MTVHIAKRKITTKLGDTITTEITLDSATGRVVSEQITVEGPPELLENNHRQRSVGGKLWYSEHAA